MSSVYVARLRYSDASADQILGVRRTEVEALALIGRAWVAGEWLGANAEVLTYPLDDVDPAEPLPVPAVAATG